jgi:hypothetical protein
VKSRRHWVWVGILGASLVYLLTASKLAYDANALGAWATGLVAVVWAVTVLAPLAGVFGIVAAFREPSTAAAFRVFDSLVGRLAIIAVSLGLGTVLLVAARGTKPSTDWSCRVARTRVLPPDENCGHDAFVRMKVFDLELRRATPGAEQATVLATAIDRARAAATIFSEKCGGNGPDSPQRGQSQLALGPLCGADQTFSIEVAVCDLASTEAAQLRAAANLVIVEGNNSTSLDCVGDDGGPVVVVRDAEPSRDASSAACPDPPGPLGPGQGWLYVRAESNGTALGTASNHAELYTRRSNSEAPPGLQGDADDPCLVARYAQTDEMVLVWVTADHFISQSRQVSPVACEKSHPCIVELPRSLDDAYYVTSSTGIRIKTENEVTTDHAAFEAAVTADALARSKELHHSFGDELARVAKATNVPARNLAIRYSERKLKKKCDAGCLDDTQLDPAVRDYLGKGTRPGSRNPFEPE